MGQQSSRVYAYAGEDLLKAPEQDVLIRFSYEKPDADTACGTRSESQPQPLLLGCFHVLCLPPL